MFAKHPPNTLDIPARTITTKDYSSGNEYVTDGETTRKLTNAELQILQGFPKDYKFCGSKTSVKRQIGNAVPPPVIKAYFDQL